MKEIRPGITRPVACPESAATAASLAVAGLPTEGLPGVAVVIVNHEREEEALQAVRSALDQDYVGPTEIYFVYDRRRGVERLLERLPPEVVALPYSPSPAESPVAAKRNLALRASTEPLVAFLDDDDLWDRRKLSAQVACLLHHPDAVLCCTGWTTNNSSGQGAISGTSSTQRLPRRKVTLAGAITTSSTLVRGDAVRQACFDERNSRFGVEDYDLWLRLVDHGSFWKMEAELTVMRPDGDSLSSRDRSSQHLRAASVVAEHLRRDGLRADGVAALLWFLGCACAAERGSTLPQFAPVPLDEILDGNVLGKADPLVGSLARRLLESGRAVWMGRLARRGVARLRRARSSRR